MYIEELKEVINSLNEKYTDIDLAYENIDKGEYRINFICDELKTWDGKYTCEFLEVYEVAKDNCLIGYIGRTVGRSAYGLKWTSNFGIAEKIMILKNDWEVL